MCGTTGGEQPLDQCPATRRARPPATALGSVDPSNITCIPTQTPEHRAAAGEPEVDDPRPVGRRRARACRRGSCRHRARTGRRRPAPPPGRPVSVTSAPTRSSARTADCGRCRCRSRAPRPWRLIAAALRRVSASSRHRCAASSAISRSKARMPRTDGSTSLGRHGSRRARAGRGPAGRAARARSTSRSSGVAVPERQHVGEGLLTAPGRATPAAASERRQARPGQPPGCDDAVPRLPHQPVDRTARHRPGARVSTARPSTRRRTRRPGERAAATGRAASTVEPRRRRGRAAGPRRSAGRTAGPRRPSGDDGDGARSPRRSHRVTAAGRPPHEHEAVPAAVRPHVGQPRARALPFALGMPLDARVERHGGAQRTGHAP